MASRSVAARMLRFVAYLSVFLLLVATAVGLLPGNGLLRALEALIGVHVVWVWGGLMLVTIAISILFVRVARGIDEGQPWARYAGIACGVALLPMLPVGTLVSALVLVPLIWGWSPVEEPVEASDARSAGVAKPRNRPPG